LSVGATVLVGIVGYTPVVDAYPLGPRLMAALLDRLAGNADVSVEGMSWSPIHSVQRLQDEGVARPRRVVLAGAASVCTCPGRVHAFRWMGGGIQPTYAMQERMSEAVTGIVDIENTLVIGSYFGVWPGETYSVEVELPADTFGQTVIADSQGFSRQELAAHLGFDPETVIKKITAMVVAFATNGSGSSVSAAPKTARDLAAIRSFIHNRIVISA
jgi:hypothetical protein